MSEQTLLGADDVLAGEPCGSGRISGVDGIEDAWKTRSDDLAFHAAGSWGPAEATELAARHGVTWRRM